MEVLGVSTQSNQVSTMFYMKKRYVSNLHCSILVAAVNQRSSGIYFFYLPITCLIKAELQAELQEQLASCNI